LSAQLSAAVSAITASVMAIGFESLPRTVMRPDHPPVMIPPDHRP
jgi:hypothetical protein